MKSLRGFTIIELIVSLAIASMLAAVSVSSYQKYVKVSKESEGYVMLRKIVDSELAFAANPIYVNQQGETCRFYEGFIRVESYHEDNNNTAWYSTLPPKGVKSSTISFYARDFSNSNYEPVPNLNNVCGYSRTSTNRMGGVPMSHLLNFTPSFSPLLSSGSVTVKSDYIEPGYFLYLAARSAQVAAETGYVDAYMVQAIADLDGVSPSSYNVMEYNADNNFAKEYLTVLARGIYFDTNGEPKTQGAIYKQSEQGYDTSSSSSSYTSGSSQSDLCNYLSGVYGIDYCNKYY